MKLVDRLALSASALAFALALAAVPAAAQTDDAAQGEPAANTNAEGGATGSAVGPITEGKIGEESAENTSTSETPGQGLGVMDDATLTTKLSAQGYMNARDFVRSDTSVWLVADRDGQMVRVAVVPITVRVLPGTTARIGGTDDADGGDGGAPATAAGGSSEGIGDASGAEGGDGGSVSVVAREDVEAYRQQIEAMGYANPRDFLWSNDSVWAVADKDGEVVHIYMIPSGGTVTVQ